MNELQQRVVAALDQMDAQAQRETAEFAELMASMFPKPMVRPQLCLIVSNAA